MPDNACHPHSVPDQLSLALREMAHRSNNDLQMLVSLLATQRSASDNPQARSALEQAMSSVAVFARLRMASVDGLATSLGDALDKVGDALRHISQPRSIEICVAVGRLTQEPEASAVLSVALAVNELVTNAIKHAFEEGQPGTIFIHARETGDGEIHIVVEDDGKPLLPPVSPGNEKKLGMDLARQLMKSTGGRLSMPEAGAKAFELIVPVGKV